MKSRRMAWSPGSSPLSAIALTAISSGLTPCSPASRNHPLHGLGIDVTIEAHAPSAYQLDLDPGRHALDDDRGRRWRLTPVAPLDGRPGLGRDLHRQEGRSLRLRLEAER